MILVKKSLSAEDKLKILSRDSQFDLACACAPRDDEHRRRSQEGKWIYPVVLPNGGTTYLFKILLSNECVNHCKYCPLRAAGNAARCSLEPEELVRLFLAYYRGRRVSGLFLSSGVTRDPDTTMERINCVAAALRRMKFRGYIHLKIIPGASEAAIRQSLGLATAVSLNIETAGEQNFKLLSANKNYARDILRPIQLISRLTAREGPYPGVKQTTQFVVGASRETDRDILLSSWDLYRQLKLARVYFSAYQRGEGTPDLPGENSPATNHDLLTREHRLYQADWLMRKYGFRADEIPVTADGNLSLAMDPKETWARLHPEYFPVDLNRDAPERLLRIPGLGQVTVERILAFRREGVKLRSVNDLGKRTKLLKKAEAYVTF